MYIFEQFVTLYTHVSMCVHIHMCTPLSLKTRLNHFFCFKNACVFIRLYLHVLCPAVYKFVLVIPVSDRSCKVEGDKH